MLGMSFVGFAKNMSSMWELNAAMSRIRWNRIFHKKYSEKFEKINEREQQILDTIHKELLNPHPELSALKCVECQQPFRLVNILDIKIDYCATCRSCWFDPKELAMLSETDVDVPSDHLGFKVSRYACPVCGLRMREHVYLAPKNLLVDKCPRGHGVYLEDHELERVFEINYSY